MAGQAWEKWYNGDWRRDPTVRSLRVEGRAVWFECLSIMMEGGADCYEVSGVVEDLALDFGFKVGNMLEGIRQIEKSDAADVVWKTDMKRFGNADETTEKRSCNAHVTLVSRRRKKEAKKAENRRKRVKRYREKQSNDDDSSDVTEKKRSSNGSDTQTHVRVRADSDSVSDSTKVKDETGGECERGVPFDDFWDAYGHKVDRGKCLRKWKALSAEDQRRALDFAPWYREHCEGHSWLKQRMPATFLNNENWNDQQLPDGSQVFRDDDGTVTGIEIRKDYDGKATGKLSARQNSELTVAERLERMGY